MVCPIPRTGRLGFAGDFTGDVLTRFPRFRNWVLNSTSSPEVRRYSGLRFGTQRIPGFVEHSGTFEGFGGRPPLFVGDTFRFIGYTAPTTGVPCTPGCAYILPAMVNSLTITWNWTQENKGVNWSIGFQGTGALTTNATYDDPCDDLVYCDPNPCNLTFVMKDPCAADAVVEWCNLVSATLTFTNESVAYSNNSTSCTVARDVGNLDWTLDVVDQNTCIIPTLGSDYWFEIADSATTKWILKWGQFLDIVNYRVDAETNTMIDKTNRFGMQAVNCCVPATPVRGSILNPAGVTVWPFTAA